MLDRFSPTFRKVKSFGTISMLAQVCLPGFESVKSFVLFCFVSQCGRRLPFFLQKKTQSMQPHASGAYSSAENQR